MDEIPLAPVPDRAKQYPLASSAAGKGSNPSAAAPGEPRRDFISQALAVVIGTGVVVPPLAAGVVMFLDPVLRKDAALASIRIAPLAAVPDDGVPRPFAVLADCRDAWTTQLDQPIGKVYLRRQPGSDKVQAFNATCPHAGCMVDFKPERNQFQCPCHTSAFEIDGARVMPCVSPRDLDDLKCEVRSDGGEPSVYVEFVNFYSGMHEKKPKV